MQTTKPVALSHLRCVKKNAVLTRCLQQDVGGVNVMEEDNGC